MPPSSACSAGTDWLRSSSSAGFDEHGHAVAVGDAAQRPANHVDDALRLRRDRAGDHLLGGQQRKLAGLRGEHLGELVARVGDGTDRLGERGQQRCRLGAGPLEPVGVTGRMAVGAGLLANRFGICRSRGP